MRWIWFCKWARSRMYNNGCESLVCYLLPIAIQDTLNDDPASCSFHEHIFSRHSVFVILPTCANIFASNALFTSPFETVATTFGGSEYGIGNSITFKAK